MKKTFLLILALFVLTSVPKSFGAFRVKHNTGVSSIILKTDQPANNIAADYERQKLSMAPYLLEYRWQHKEKCLVSKIGRGTMLGGAGIIVVGTLIAFTKSNEVTGPFDFSDRAEWLLGSWLLGIVVVVIGGILAIGGGIYNLTKSRYSVVADKKNEVGIAYNFK